jgi:predicted component of type VI protein secretion system
MFLYKHFVRGPKTSLLDDITRNINYVLNTKRGYGYFLESFGLSDIGFRTTEEMVTLISAEIKENLRLYEPRVEVKGVDEVYEEGKRPRLVVSLRLRGHDEKLELVVDMGARSFDIRRVEPKEPQ